MRVQVELPIKVADLKVLLDAALSRNVGAVVKGRYGSTELVLTTEPESENE